MMLSKIKRISWKEGLYFLLIFLIGFPSLFVIWAFVDDGQSALVSQRMTQAFTSGNILLFLRQLIEPEIGRFRPFYWIYQWFTFILAGNSRFLHHAIHFILFFVVAWLFFATIKNATKSLNVAFLAGLFFVLNSINIENWYRLGPQEPLLVLLQISSLFFLLKSPGRIHLFLSLLFLFLSFFTKETAIAFIPVSFFVWLFMREKRFVIYLLASVIFGILTRAIAMVIGSSPNSYASFYQLDLSRIIHNSLLFVRYMIDNFDPLFSLACLFFGVTLIYNLKARNFKLNKVLIWQVIGLIWFISFVVIQSPWAFVLPRYFLPASMGIAIFMGLEYHCLFSFIANVQKNNLLSRKANQFLIFFNLSIIFLFIIVFVYNGLSIINYEFAVTSDFDERMLRLVSQTASYNQNIYFNFQKGDVNLELNYEIPLHLSIFWGRRDLRFGYLDFESKNSLKDGDIIISGNGVPAYPEEKLLNYPGIVEAQHLERNVPNFGFVRPLNLIAALAGFKKPRDPLYKVSYSQYNWYVYQFREVNRE